MPTNPQFSLRTLMLAVACCAGTAWLFTRVKMGDVDGMDGMLFLWLVQVLYAGVLSAPILIFGRRRARWHAWELAAFVLPFWAWAACLIVDNSGKSLANLAEFLTLCIGIPVAALIRVVIGHRQRQWAYSGALILALCILGVATCVLTPPLPE